MAPEAPGEPDWVLLWVLFKPPVLLVRALWALTGLRRWMLESLLQPCAVGMRPCCTNIGSLLAGKTCDEKG